MVEKKKTTKKQCQVCGDSGIMGDGHFSEYTPCNYCERGFMQFVRLDDMGTVKCTNCYSTLTGEEKNVTSQLCNDCYESEVPK